MTVRSKISITIASAFLCLITAIYVLYSQFVMQDYSLIEHIEMETNLKRVKFVVETTENQLLGTTKDWAWWDDTYDFMANHGEEFKKSWFTIDSFKALNITHAVFLNSNGDFDFGVLVDLENEVITEISKSDIEVRSSK